MATSKKTKISQLMGSGQMKALVGINVLSVPTKISKTFATKLERNNNLANRLKKFWEELLKEDAFLKEIIVKVSDFFGHRVEGQKVPQRMSNTFLERVFNPCKDMEICIPEVLPTLNEYVLPMNMDDTTIQRNTDKKPMSLKEYWLVRYILLVKGVADKTKVYIFHVQVGDKVVALFLRWDGAEWDSRDYAFGHGGWIAGAVFVSLP